MTTQHARARSALLPPPSSRARRFSAALAAGVIGVGLLAAATPAQANGTHFFCPDNTQPYVPVAEVEAFTPGDTVTGLSVTDSAVEGVLSYKLKKGSTARSFEWTGPGVVSDSAEATFTIKA